MWEIADGSLINQTNRERLSGSCTAEIAERFLGSAPTAQLGDRTGPRDLRDNVRFSFGPLGITTLQHHESGLITEITLHFISRTYGKGKRAFETGKQLIGKGKLSVNGCCKPCFWNGRQLDRRTSIEEVRTWKGEWHLDLLWSGRC
jgi:hypothetical protein